MRIDIKDNIEINKMILNLNQEKFINKQMNEEELNKLIKELSLFNIKRTELITINQLIKYLKDIDIITHTYKQIDLNSIDDNKAIIIYRFELI